MRLRVHKSHLVGGGGGGSVRQKERE